MTLSHPTNGESPFNDVNDTHNYAARLPFMELIRRRQPLRDWFST